MNCQIHRPAIFIYLLSNHLSIMHRLVNFFHQIVGNSQILYNIVTVNQLALQSENED